MVIEIISPDALLYSGEVNQAILPGKGGFFEILNNHAPIVSVLKKGQIKILDKNNQKFTFDINGGVIEMQKNKIIILTE